MHGIASDDSDDRRSTDDSWRNTLISVCGFLAGFSLASIIGITNDPSKFRWSGGAVLVLTIASVVLATVTMIARRDPQTRIWVPYHIGISILSLGLGFALAPVTPPTGVGTQEILRWIASGIAWLACAVDLFFTVKWLKKPKSLVARPQNPHQ
jgi:hypothetical protein